MIPFGVLGRLDQTLLWPVLCNPSDLLVQVLDARCPYRAFIWRPERPRMRGKRYRSQPILRLSLHEAEAPNVVAARGS